MAQKESNISLTENVINWLWQQLVKKYASKPGKNVPEALIKNPKTLWDNNLHLEIFLSDFNKVTSYKNSKMPMPNDDFRDSNISKAYFYDHFISLKKTKFNEFYLNKIIYYLTEDLKKAEYQTFFESQGIQWKSESIGSISPGVQKLEGHWVGFSRNIEPELIVTCLYKFKQVGDKMTILREAYNAEVRYEGEVHTQDDSSYIFILDGKIKNKKKFIIADTEKLIPHNIRCLSSGFAIKDGKPIIMKELIVKLPEDQKPPIQSGSAILLTELENYLSRFFKDTHIIYNEIMDYLSDGEMAAFSLDDLVNIKKADLQSINNRGNNTKPSIKKLMAYYRFDRISEPYQREVIKYYRSDGEKEETVWKNTVTVEDQYQITKIAQYEYPSFIKHPVYYEAESANGVVDVQSLFPLLESDAENDLKEPILKISNRVMDAHSDIFVSNTTVINDFTKKNRFDLHFDKETNETELVFDFSSVPFLVNSGLYLSDITYHYNDPDGDCVKVIKLKIPVSTARSLELLSINKTNGSFEHLVSCSIDKHNAALFVVKINFPTQKDDLFYFHFNFLK